jgi:hypothetical protein
LPLALDVNQQLSRQGKCGQGESHRASQARRNV